MWSWKAEKKQLYGIEVKAASSVEKKDFRGLRYLWDVHPKKFTKGILLYTGDPIMKFEDNLYAVPVSALWAS